MTNAAATSTVSALLSAPQVVAAVLHAVHTGGRESAAQVGRDIEALIDPCAMTAREDGGHQSCVPFYDQPEPGPYTAAHRAWLTTCTA